MPSLSRFSSPVILLALASMIPATAWARWATLEDADAVVDFENTQVNVQADGKYQLTVEQQTEILKDSARASRGVMRLDYNSRASTLKILDAYTINDGQKFPVDLKLIEDKPLASSGEGFDQINQVMIVFPEVTIGSKIYVKYEKDLTEVPIKGHFSMKFVNGWYDYSKADHVTITSERPLYFVSNNPDRMVKIKTSHRGGKYKLTIDQDQPIYKRPVDEDNALLDPDTAPWVDVSTDNDWSKYPVPVLADYDRILNSQLPPAYEKIRKKAAKKKTFTDQVNTVTSMLADEVHYMGDWRPVKGGYIPRPLAEVARTRFGDCKDFAAATAAILRKLGIEADVAWVFRGATPVYEKYALPVDSDFNHAIVWAKVDGKVHWIDPTNFASFAQGIFDDIIDRSAVVLAPKHPSLQKIPSGSPEDGTIDLDIALDLSSDQEVHASGTAALLGREALWMTGTGLNASKESVDYTIARWVSQSPNLKSWKVGDFDFKSRIVKDMKVPFKFVETASPTKTSAGPAFEIASPYFVKMLLTNTDDRVSDLFLRQPYTFKRRYLLKNVKRVGEQNLNCSIESDDITASREVADVAQGVQITDQVRFKKALLPNDELVSGDFHKLQKKLRDCFDKVAIVYQKKGAKLP